MREPMQKMTPELSKRLQQILDNEVPPPDEVAGYLADTVRDTQGELAQVTNQLNQMVQQVQNLEAMKLQLQGVANRAMSDFSARVFKSMQPAPLAAVPPPPQKETKP